MFQSKINRRTVGLLEWIERNCPEITKEQAHLREGTPERAYWHFGYLMALRDVLALTDHNVTEIFDSETHRLDKYN